MDGAARYWGVLNRLRGAAVETYAQHLPFHRSQSGGPDFIERLFPGGKERIVGRRQYATRAPLREAWRRTLDELGAAWNGRVESDGVGPGCRFLAEHYPECAPMMMLLHQGGSSEEVRLSLTGTVGHCPVFVEIIDFAHQPGRFVRPPIMVVFLACRMDLTPPPELPKDAPFRTVPPPPKLDETEPHRALKAKGLVVGWTWAGAYAIHDGPADALLSAASLAWIADTLFAFCRAAPATEHALAPIAPVEDGGADYDRVIDAFLSALRDRHALGALAHAYPNLFPASGREPTPALLDEAIDGAGARPRRWERVGVTDNGEIDRSLKIDLGGPDLVQASVYLTRLEVSGRWTVCGYTVGSKLVIGHEFVDPA